MRIGYDFAVVFVFEQSDAGGEFFERFLERSDEPGFRRLGADDAMSRRQFMIRIGLSLD